MRNLDINDILKNLDMDDDIDESDVMVFLKNILNKKSVLDYHDRMKLELICKQIDVYKQVKTSFKGEKIIQNENTKLCCYIIIGLLGYKFNELKWLNTAFKGLDLIEEKFLLKYEMVKEILDQLLKTVEILGENI